MNRREFLKTVGAACVGAASAHASTARPDPLRRKVMTVLGPASPDDMGVTLPHEHVPVDFVGADNARRLRSNPT